MNASKFIAIAAIATAFGGTAFAGELSYNDGVATKAQSTVSSLSRAEVQSQAGASIGTSNSLSYNDGVAATKSQAAAVRSRDEVRAEATERSFSRSLAYNTGA